MKRKSIHKTKGKKTSDSFYSKILSLPMQIRSFILGMIAAVKTALSPKNGKTKDTGTVELLPTDTPTELASIKAKEIWTSLKAKVKKLLVKAAEIIMSAKDEAETALGQAKAKRAFNKAAKKAARERRAEEKLALESAAAKQTSVKSKTNKSASNIKSRNITSSSKKKKKKKKKKIPLYRRVVSLMIKILITVFSLIIVFGYIFGLSRNQSLNMQPAFQDGDLILYLRTDNSYSANDTVVILYEEKTMVERVIAIGGDTVDITEDGLIVNGGRVQESYAWGETTQFENGVTFPLTVPEGKIFVLGDNREHATDSRILGCIDERDVSGSVIGAFRRRNF